MDHDATILLTTAYLPPISWMHAACKAGSVVIEAHETYSRQTYRNRCNLITANGPMALSIPVAGHSGEKVKTKDVEIFYGEPWQRLHWRTMDAANCKLPFNPYYLDKLKPYFERKQRFLLDFNMAILEKVLELIDINITLKLTEEWNPYPAGDHDLRQSFSPKKKDNSSVKPYPQVFEERHGFIPDLSIIDLLFNEGPAAKAYLKSEL